jgi:hypothetical protein
VCLTMDAWPLAATNSFSFRTLEIHPFERCASLSPRLRSRDVGPDMLIHLQIVRRRGRFAWSAAVNTTLYPL